MALMEFHPVPIWVRRSSLPVPVPGYIHSRPSVVRATRSELPSPSKSPGLCRLVMEFHPLLPISSRGSKRPAPLPG
jgi:hypothetical protein